MYKIEIKGITHDWMAADSFKTEALAIKAMKKVIKAGRKETHIRVTKEIKGTS